MKLKKINKAEARLQLNGYIIKEIVSPPFAIIIIFALIIVFSLFEGFLIVRKPSQAQAQLQESVLPTYNIDNLILLNIGATSLTLEGFEGQITWYRLGDFPEFDIPHQNIHFHSLKDTYQIKDNEPY